MFKNPILGQFHYDGLMFAAVPILTVTMHVLSHLLLLMRSEVERLRIPPLQKRSCLRGVGGRAGIGIHS